MRVLASIDKLNNVPDISVSPMDSKNLRTLRTFEQANESETFYEHVQRHVYPLDY